MILFKLNVLLPEIQSNKHLTISFFVAIIKEIQIKAKLNKKY
jgi:hypothetical protein